MMAAIFPTSKGSRFPIEVENCRLVRVKCLFSTLPLLQCQPLGMTIPRLIPPKFTPFSAGAGTVRGGQGRVSNCTIPPCFLPLPMLLPLQSPTVPSLFKAPNSSRPVHLNQETFETMTSTWSTPRRDPMTNSARIAIEGRKITQSKTKRRSNPGPSRYPDWRSGTLWDPTYLGPPMWLPFLRKRRRSEWKERQPPLYLRPARQPPKRSG